MFLYAPKTQQYFAKKLPLEGRNNILYKACLFILDIALNLKKSGINIIKAKYMATVRHGFWGVFASTEYFL